MSKKVSMSELSPLIKEALEEGREVIVNVTGSSMQPLLYENRDKVSIVKPAEPMLRKYAIPLYQSSDGAYKLHRIVAVGKQGLVMAGDHQCTKEYPVQSSQVLGIVKGFWRKGNYISCENLWYRLYNGFWVGIFPFRRYLIRGAVYLHIWRKDYER